MNELNPLTLNVRGFSIELKLVVGAIKICAIAEFLNKHNDPNNFRQLQSHFPKRVQVLWQLKQFPQIVASELRLFGWTEDTQAAIVARKQARLTSSFTHQQPV